MILGTTDIFQFTRVNEFALQNGYQISTCMIKKYITGTYPISTAFHSFKKAQFQLLDPDPDPNPDPDPDWRFESGANRIRIRNTGINRG